MGKKTRRRDDERKEKIKKNAAKKCKGKPTHNMNLTEMPNKCNHCATPDQLYTNRHEFQQQQNIEGHYRPPFQG